MDQPPTNDDTTRKWYLFIGESICLKVPGTLSIGEDTDGLIVFNPKKHQQLLLRVKSDKSGRLLIKAVRKTQVLDWEEGGASVVDDQLSLLPSTRIVLPHNELYFNHEMQRGKVSANIALRDLANQTEALEAEALKVDVEPILLTVPVESQPTQTAAIEAREHAPEWLKEDDDVFTEPRVMDTQTESRSRPTKWLVVGPVTVIGAALGAVLGYAYFFPEGLLPKETPVVSSEPVKEPILAPQTKPALKEPYRLIPADVQPASTETELLATPDDIGLQDSIDPQGLPANLEEEELSKADIPVDPQTARRLARARNYFDQGFITSPLEANAVKELSRILYVDPTNQEALNLMSDSANKLVSAAVEAHAAGLEFEARNLMEEVLGFHPEHAQANEIWRQWTN